MAWRGVKGIGWAWLGLLLLAQAAPALPGAPRFWPAVRLSTGTSATLGPGIVYSRYVLRTSAGPLRIYHLRLNLTDPEVRLGVGLAQNRLMSRDETVSSMAGRTGAVAGVNGDFFDIGGSGMPLNLVVQAGRLLRSPSGWVALAIAKDGSARIVRFRWGGSILLPGTRATYWVRGFNTGTLEDGLTVLSNARGYGVSPPSPGMRQTVAALTPAPRAPDAGVREPPAAPGSQPSGTFISTVSPPAAPDPGTLYTAAGVWLQGPYYAPFPKGTLLLVGRGAAADWLRRHVTAGTAVRVNLATDPDWHGLHAAIGGGPRLVRKGRLADDPHSPVPGERYVRNPVGAVGLSKDGRTMLLVAVDGRRPRGSIGLTQPQLAAYMMWLGAYQAMEFDSGGSVTMAVRFPGRPWPMVVNAPSDGRERPVADALLVYSVPVGLRTGTDETAAHRDGGASASP